MRQTSYFRGADSRLRGAVTVAVLGVALALASRLEATAAGTLTSTAWLLAIALAPFVLLSHGRVIRVLHSAIAAGGRPVARYTLLTVAGIGLAIGSVVNFERAESKVLDLDLAELEFVHAQVPSGTSVREKAVTDRGTPIVLLESTDPRASQHLSDVEERALSSGPFRDLAIRVGAADDRSNCHGWVFTGGRFLIRGNEVEVILRENNYVEQRRPEPGDLVIFRNPDRTISHTAVVRYVTAGEPVLVRSKWGNLGVFTHSVDDSPYGTEYTFYRSSRTGHLLTTTPITASDISPNVTTE